MHRLADGVDPDVITTAEAAAGAVPGVIHAHARWTGRTLRVEIEGWVDPDMSARDADELDRTVADEISRCHPPASRGRRLHLDHAGNRALITRGPPPRLRTTGWSRHRFTAGPPRGSTCQVNYTA
jgi:hypothetical protein